MTSKLLKGLAAGLALAAFGIASAASEGVVTVEILNLSSGSIEFATLVPEGAPAADGMQNLLARALEPRSGALVTAAPGTYRLATSGSAGTFTSADVVALGAGDVVTLTVTANGLATTRHASGADQSKPAAYSFTKLIGQQLPSK
jgi:hypothetical protein